MLVSRFGTENKQNADNPEWTRRDRFIATCAFALGLASLCVPEWFNYIFTYQGDNAGLKGLLEAIVLIVEEPYLISALLAVFLNATLAAEFEEHPSPFGKACRFAPGVDYCLLDIRIGLLPG
jgi:xanthine/uracil permease